MLDVCLLGTGGMTPLPKRWLSSLLVRFQGHLLLIDSGEGTQISLKIAGWGFKEIGNILLTHLHADHVAGLPGLLLTIGNSGRRDWVVLYGPTGLERVVEGVRAIAPQLPFPLEWRELAGGERLDLGGLEVSTLAVDHAVPCLAYSLLLPRGRRFNPELAAQVGVPVRLWSTLQAGEPVEWNGKRVEPDQVLGEKRRGLRLSYVTDTRPTPSLPALIEGSDLLICEGMYGSPEDLPKALGNRHMLFSEAAQIARDGHVRELWLTHYSPSLSDPEFWLSEATRIFPNTRAGHDRSTATLRFDQP
jgi:ribonuclease Z